MSGVAHRAHAMAGHPGHRGHDLRFDGFPEHVVCISGVFEVQQHSSREVFHEGVVLHYSGRNDRLPRQHFRDSDETLGGVVRLESLPSGSQLRHDLRSASHQNQPHRQDPRREQEEIPHEKTPLHVRHSSSRYHLFPGGYRDFHRGRDALLPIPPTHLRLFPQEGTITMRHDPRSYRRPVGVRLLPDNSVHVVRR